MSSARLAAGRRSRRLPARPRPAASPRGERARPGGARVYRIEDARRRAEAARTPVETTRALLAEARAKWLEATLAIARVLGHARPLGIAGASGVVGARRWGAQDGRRATGATRPGAAEFGGVEAIAWFGEAR
jgi:hypothetical protein